MAYAGEVKLDCARLGCIALAIGGDRYCVVHRTVAGPDRGAWVPPYQRLQPVDDGRIERDADGLPTKFYPLLPRGRS